MPSWTLALITCVRFILTTVFTCYLQCFQECVLVRSSFLESKLLSQEVASWSQSCCHTVLTHSSGSSNVGGCFGPIVVVAAIGLSWYDSKLPFGASPLCLPCRCFPHHSCKHWTGLVCSFSAVSSFGAK